MRTESFTAFLAHFAAVGEALKDGENEITLRLSSPEAGTVFRGAWLDWPQF
jgi:hypothetical protein